MLNIYFLIAGLILIGKGLLNMRWTENVYRQFAERQASPHYEIPSTTPHSMRASCHLHALYCYSMAILLFYSSRPQPHDAIWQTLLAILAAAYWMGGLASLVLVGRKRIGLTILVLGVAIFTSLGVIFA